MLNRLMIRCVGLAALWLSAAAAGAAPTWPGQINYQGQLTDVTGNAVADGAYSIVFSLYKQASGGSAVWTETQPSVAVAKGLFNVQLGSVSALPAPGPGSSYLYAQNDLYLGVKVGADPEMTPRQQLLPAAFAISAYSLGGLQASATNTANNLVVLDATGKIPAGLVQAGSISAPFDLTGSAAYGLNVLNGSAASTAVGLTVSASNAIVAQAGSGMGLSVSTASLSNPAIFASSPYPLRLLVGNGVSGNLGLQAGTPNDDLDAYLVDRSHLAAVWANSTAAGATGVSATSATGSGVIGTTNNGSDATQAGVLGLNNGAGAGVAGFGVTGVAGVASATNGIAVGGINNNASAGSGAFGVLGQVASSSAIGVAGINTGATGTGVVGRHLGTGVGMGVRGISPNGVGAFGVFGTVSGTGAIGVNGNAGGTSGVGVSGFSANQNGLTVGNAGIGVEGVATALDAFGVVGIQGYPGSAQNLAPSAAGVYGKTAQGLAVGTGVRGEGNQGLVGVSSGYCALCGYNLSTAPYAYGAYINSPNLGLWVDSTGTAAATFAVTGNIASVVAGSAAATFQASGTSGQTYGVNAVNASPNGYAVYASGGHDGVHAAAQAGGNNFYSDPANGSKYGLYHSDLSGLVSGAVGVYSTENCPDCFGGVFTNTNATSGNGAALNVNGRLRVQNSAGIFVAPNGATTYTLSNSYMTPTSLLFLTVASATGSVAAVTTKATGSAVITFTPALSADTTYQFLIIGQ
jgi:hypothetical protein